MIEQGFAVEWAIRELAGELRATITLHKLSRAFRGSHAKPGFWTNGDDLQDAARRLRVTVELLQLVRKGEQMSEDSTQPKDLGEQLTGRTITEAEWHPNPHDPSMGWTLLHLDNGARLYSDDPAYYAPEDKTPDEEEQDAATENRS